MGKSYTIEITDNCAGLAEVDGFSLAGVACDIRNKNDFNRLDLALIKLDRPCAAAGVFTTNDVKAAPVLTDIAHLSLTQTISAIVANSGNANACTGGEGLRDAAETCAKVAGAIGCEKHQVLVCSTGRIGERLPMEKISKGIAEAAACAAPTKENGLKAASAILTSDTKIKVVCAQVLCNGRMFRIAGMAKGAGMIEPNMATMLCFIGSDADASQSTIKQALSYAVGKSFNRITIDGDMSTNDTVLAVCSAKSGVKVEPSTEEFEAFREALTKVCRELARKIVADGERITKVVETRVRGAKSPEQAEKICRAICNSLLVKSSWYGSDPNWGRLADAAGYARTGLDFSKMDLFYDEVPVLIKGEAQAQNKALWKSVVSKKEFVITMDLNLGDFEESLLTTDLSEAYVDFNKGE
ncbi:MAG: bifunctional glutamate N-acetyltransferase/amino-acid acetyltransferase ArgJ [Opitutales bacterium]|nr:bifunctional glutamate N-acetyltransferase/amino-acid acetyltransferase ArgJ [Opitutales bacterium]